METLTRRALIRKGSAFAGSLALLGLTACGGDGASTPRPLAARPSPPAPEEGQPYLAAMRGTDPATITRAAIDALGGMTRFVSGGDRVVVKPNICVDYHPPEYAATTNPHVVGEIVRMCLEAGASRVDVMDMPFGGTPESAYKISGIQEAVEAAGGTMVQMTPVGFVKTEIPEGVVVTSCEVYRDILTANAVIDVPIAKHHNLARLSLGTKNMLGVVTRPQRFHLDIGRRLADLLSLVRPTLTVVDAYRILVAHGPTGGSLNDVEPAETIIASHDTVAADAYAATLFDLTGEEIPFLKAAADRGLGTLKLSDVEIAQGDA